MHVSAHAPARPGVSGTSRWSRSGPPELIRSRIWDCCEFVPPPGTLHHLLQPSNSCTSWHTRAAGCGKLRQWGELGPPTCRRSGNMADLRGRMAESVVSSGFADVVSRAAVVGVVLPAGASLRGIPASVSIPARQQLFYRAFKRIPAVWYNVAALSCRAGALYVCRDPSSRTAWLSLCLATSCKLFVCAVVKRNIKTRC